MNESPVLTQIQNEYDKPAKVDFDSFARKAGFDTEKINAQVDNELQQQQAQAAPQPQQTQDPAQEAGLQDNSGQMAASLIANKNKIKADIGKGVVQGMADLAQGAANAAISLGDWVENTAASYGLGKGDLISDSDRIDWAKKLQSSEDTVTTKVARGLTKVVAPMVATAPFTGPVGMIASSGAASFLTAEKDAERLTNLVKDMPSVRNFPAVYEALDWMSSKPGETDIEARAKSALESVIIAAPIAGLFHGTTKAISMMKQAKNAQKLETAAQGVPTIADDLAANADNAVAPATADEALNVKPAEVPVPEHPIYNYEPTISGADGAVKANANNSDVIEVLREYRQANPDLKMADILNVPTTYAQRAEDVKAFMANKEQMAALLSWRRGARPLTDIETKVLQHMSRDVVDEIRDFSKIAATSKNPEDTAHMQNLIGYLEYTLTLEDGTGSAASKTLDANKLLAEIQGLPVKDAVAKQTEAQRKMLLKNVLKNAGGEASAQEIAKKLKAIAEMSPEKIHEMVARMDAADVPAYKRVANAVTQVAINGMLSSIKTTVGNHISNATTFSKTITDAYTAAGINWVTGLYKTSPEGVTFAQANAHLKGSVGALREAFGAIGEAFKTGKGGPANVVNADILDIKGSLSSLRLMPEITEESSAGMQAIAKMADKVDMVVSTPSRLNATADSFWGTMLYRGKLQANAVFEGEKAGLKGNELRNFVDKFIENPTLEQHEAARVFALETTFSKAMDPKGIAQAFQTVIDKVPLGRVLFPFFKTQSNIIEYAVKNSPIGLMHPDTWQAFQNGGREAQMAAAKIGTGSMFLGLFAYEAATGNVTGDDTRNPAMKQALNEAGAQFIPNALKIGDSVVDLRRIEPLNSYVRLGSALSRISGHVPPDEYQSAVWAASSHIAAFLTPEMMVQSWASYLDTLALVAKSADEPTEKNIRDRDNAAEKLAADVSMRFLPFSGALRDIKGVVDPVQRDQKVGKINEFTDRMINKYKAVVPWLSDDLPAQRNMFGEKIVMPDGLGPDFMSPIATSNPKSASGLSKMMEKLAGFYQDNRSLHPDLPEMSIRMPDRDFQIEGVRIDLTPKEYEKYIMYFAGLDPQTEKALPNQRTLREVMDKVVTSAAPLFEGQMTPNQYKQATAMINAPIQGARQRAQLMMLQDPEIMGRWNKAYKAKNTLRDLPGIKE